MVAIIPGNTDIPCIGKKPEYVLEGDGIDWVFIAQNPNFFFFKNRLVVKKDEFTKGSEAMPARTGKEVIPEVLGIESPVRDIGQGLKGLKKLFEVSSGPVQDVAEGWAEFKYESTFRGNANQGMGIEEGTNQGCTRSGPANDEKQWQSLNFGYFFFASQVEKFLQTCVFLS